MDQHASEFPANVKRAIADSQLQSTMTETGPRFIEKRAKARANLPEFDALENVVLPQMIAGDMQGAMQKLHSQDKPLQQAKAAPAPKKEPEKKEAPRKEPEKKAPAVKEPPKPEPKAKEQKEDKGFLKSLFGKK